MAEQVGSRRNTVVFAGAAFGAAALGTTGDLIFNVLQGTAAKVVSIGATVATGGLVAYQALKAQREGLEQAVVSVWTRRHQLPPQEPLVGRQELLNVLFTLLSDVPAPARSALPVNSAVSRSKIVVVHGAPGVGKTALALTAAHRVQSFYPDGQLYVNLRGDGDAPKPSARALEDLLESLGVDHADIPGDVDSRSAMLRNLTNDLRLLLVLDNTHSTEQVRPLLPVGAGCSVLITSRRPLSAGMTQSRPIPVALPDENEALEVLSHYAGRERILGDPATALAITKFCDRLPLALRIVGAKVRQTNSSLRDMLALLEAEDDRWDTLEFEGDSLHRVLMVTYRDLAEQTRAALGLISVLPVGEISDWHFRSVARSRGTAFSVREELLQTGLMERHSGDESQEETAAASAGYRVHDLVRVFAAEQHEQLPPEERQQHEARMVRAYRDAAVALAARRAPELQGEVPSEVVDEFAQESAAGWMSTEEDRIREAIARGKSLGMHAEAADLGEALSYFLDDISLPAGSADWLFEAHPSETRVRVLAGLRRARAMAALAEGSPDTALALLAPALEPVDGSATSVVGPRDESVVARAYAAKQDFRLAHDHMATAVNDLRQADDVWHVLNSLEKLGEFQRWRGDPEGAERSQADALQLAERSGDVRARARLRRTLAETLGYLRRPEEAAPLLEAAIRDFRILKDRRWEGASLYALGKIYRLLGRRQEALDRYTRAEEIFGPMGERHWVGRVNNARIRVLAGMGSLDQAAATANAALRTFEELGDEMWQAHTQRDIGWLHIKAGRADTAVDPLTYAVEVTERAGDAYAGSMALHLRGVAYRELGRYAEAHADFEAALGVYRSGAYQWNEAAVTQDVVIALRAESRTADADRLAEATESANPIFARMRGRDGAVAVPDEE
ncbi:tetratricopeptide repeat protein [Streptomyces sp. F001]|uniref:tetratricopeptide repeat protein n=1 Tax=Streptomyces sp. F001 TaxID=1510026 RepID=UPI00101E2A2E|nr:tetratricopeptide repeat protein [Streptomyces sp. F001]RZB14793.1 tetratricopeptide repeat protein [Streptomyces sp. F001]